MPIALDLDHIVSVYTLGTSFVPNMLTIWLRSNTIIYAIVLLKDGYLSRLGAGSAHSPIHSLQLVQE